MYCLANGKLCYFQMPLNIEKSGQQNLECSKERLVNTLKHLQKVLTLSQPTSSRFIQTERDCRRQF